MKVILNLLAFQCWQGFNSMNKTEFYWQDSKLANNLREQTCSIDLDYKKYYTQYVSM